MVHNHDHAGVKWGGAKLGSPPPLVAPLMMINNISTRWTVKKNNSVLCLYKRISDIIKYTPQYDIKHKQLHILNSSRQIIIFIVGITILNQKFFYKDDIKIVTEFPCLLGHPVLHYVPLIYLLHYDAVPGHLSCWNSTK